MASAITGLLDFRISVFWIWGFRIVITDIYMRHCHRLCHIADAIVVAFAKESAPIHASTGARIHYVTDLA
jgi:hypothetical protein